MIPPSAAFDRYVDAARRGSVSLPRTLLGALLIGAVWTAISVAVLLAVALGRGVGSDPTESFPGEAFFATPPGLASLLFSFAGIWLGVWLALLWLQRRPLTSLLGANGRLSASNFWRGAAATLIVSLASEIALLPIESSISRGEIPLSDWLIWLVPLAALILVQTSAEEAAFRGYLMQSLAARFPSPLIWGALPAIFFALVHWNAAALPHMNLVMLLSIAAFAVVATLLVHATGELGAAMGVHFAMNFWGILLVSHAGWLNGAALFVGRPLDEHGWSVAEAIGVGANGILSMALLLVLLLHQRSPLKVVAPVT